MIEEIIELIPSEDTKKISSLLKKARPNEINQEQANGYTVLAIAVKYNYIHSAKILFDFIKTNIYDYSRVLAILLAIQNNNKELVKYLNNDEDFNIDTQTKKIYAIFVYAVNKNYYEIIELIKIILTSGETENLYIYLIIASQNNDLKAIQVIYQIIVQKNHNTVDYAYLLTTANKLQNNFNNSIPSGSVCKNKESSLLNQYTVITTATEKRHLLVFKFLLRFFTKQEEQININNAAEPDLLRSAVENAFLMSAEKGYIEIIKFITESVAINIHTVNEHGYTALAIAAYNSSKNIIKYLYQKTIETLAEASKKEIKEANSKKAGEAKYSLKLALTLTTTYTMKKIPQFKNIKKDQVFFSALYLLKDTEEKNYQDLQKSILESMVIKNIDYVYMLYVYALYYKQHNLSKIIFDFIIKHPKRNDQKDYLLNLGNSISTDEGAEHYYTALKKSTDNLYVFEAITELLKVKVNCEQSEISIIEIYTIINLAIEKNHNEIINYLVSNLKINYELLSSSGYTLLMMAAAYNNIEATKSLFQLIYKKKAHKNNYSVIMATIIAKNNNNHEIFIFLDQQIQGIQKRYIDQYLNDENIKKHADILNILKYYQIQESNDEERQQKRPRI